MITGFIVVIEEVNLLVICVYYLGGKVIWAKTEMRDLNHLNDKMKKRELTVKYMNNTLHLTTLGTTNVFSMLDSDYKRDIYFI